MYDVLILPVPETFSGLVELLEKYELDEQNVVIQRMRKCYHASLAEDNKLHLVVGMLLVHMALYKMEWLY